MHFMTHEQLGSDCCLFLSLTALLSVLVPDDLWMCIDLCELFEKHLGVHQKLNQAQTDDDDSEGESESERDDDPQSLVPLQLFWLHPALVQPLVASMLSCKVKYGKVHRASTPYTLDISKTWMLRPPLVCELAN